MNQPKQSVLRRIVSSIGGVQEQGKGRQGKGQDEQDMGRNSGAANTTTTEVLIFAALPSM
jgi:hypothetical protein